MSTLTQIMNENVKEEANRAYRYYECTRNMQAAFDKFRHVKATRVGERLLEIDRRAMWDRQIKPR